MLPHNDHSRNNLSFLDFNLRTIHPASLLCIIYHRHGYLNMETPPYPAQGPSLIPRDSPSGGDIFVYVVMGIILFIIVMAVVCWDAKLQSTSIFAYEANVDIQHR